MRIVGNLRKEPGISLHINESINRNGEITYDLFKYVTTYFKDRDSEAWSTTYYYIDTFNSKRIALAHAKKEAKTLSIPATSIIIHDMESKLGVPCGTPLPPEVFGEFDTRLFTRKSRFPLMTRLRFKILKRKQEKNKNKMLKTIKESK